MGEEENNLDESSKEKDHQNKIKVSRIVQRKGLNDKWRDFVHKENENKKETSHQKLTEDNKDNCRETKEKELLKFTGYDVYEDDPFVNYNVIGTQFVMTMKEDGTMKARFV